MHKPKIKKNAASYPFDIGSIFWYLYTIVVFIYYCGIYILKSLFHVYSFGIHSEKNETSSLL
jgi:capsule polysaccharide export protein KpsE/RkpR